MSFFRLAALYILGLVILLFIPVLIETLFLEKSFGWLFFFGLFVLIPSLLIYFIIDSGTWYYALQFFLIGLFLFFCFLLKLTISMWDQDSEPAPDLRT